MNIIQSVSNGFHDISIFLQFLQIFPPAEKACVFSGEKRVVPFQQANIVLRIHAFFSGKVLEYLSYETEKYCPNHIFSLPLREVVS